MASAIASSTSDLSIAFSRATASAICRSSSLLALTAGLAIVFTPFCRIRLVFRPIAAVANGVAAGPLLGRRDQLVGHYELGFCNVLEGELDRGVGAPRFVGRQQHS